MRHALFLALAFPCAPVSADCLTQFPFTQMFLSEHPSMHVVVFNQDELGRVYDAISLLPPDPDDVSQIVAFFMPNSDAQAVMYLFDADGCLRSPAGTFSSDAMQRIILRVKGLGV